MYLSDFEIRLNRFIPDINEQNEISKLNSLIKEKESIIDQQELEIQNLRKKSLRKKPGTRSTRTSRSSSRDKGI